MKSWISVKDKLPPERVIHSIYIVTMYSCYKHKSFVDPLHYINGEWFTIVHEEPLDPEYIVTHWMPLPKLFGNIMKSWIFMGDESPPESSLPTIYIASIYSLYIEKLFVKPLHYVNGEWYTMNDEPLDPEYTVGYWMPLPELPEIV